MRKGNYTRRDTRKAQAQRKDQVKLLSNQQAAEKPRGKPQEKRPVDALLLDFQLPELRGK